MRFPAPKNIEKSMSAVETTTTRVFEWRERDCAADDGDTRVSFDTRGVSSLWGVKTRTMVRWTSKDPAGASLRGLAYAEVVAEQNVRHSLISDRAHDLVRLHALGAHIEALGGATHQSANTLDVGVPTAVGAHVGVRHALAEARSLTADVTHGSHDRSPWFKFLSVPPLGGVQR